MGVARPPGRLSPVRVCPQVSATVVRTRLAGRHAETPPGAPPAGPGQPLGARYAVSSHQETRQEGQQETDHGHKGRLTAINQPRPAADTVQRPPGIPGGVKSQAQTLFRNGVDSVDFALVARAG
jgi:hypothetical protein